MSIKSIATTLQRYFPDAAPTTLSEAAAILYDQEVAALERQVTLLRGEVANWAGLRLDRLMAAYPLNADERKAAILYRDESCSFLRRLEEEVAHA